MIQGIIFDYGGTIDTNAIHWSEVLWEGYKAVGIPVSKGDFRDSYVFAERALAKHPYIKPNHTFLDLLKIKCDLETEDLVNRGVWECDRNMRKEKSDAVAEYCYDYVLNVLKASRPVIEHLSKTYPLVLVSNFYGNIETILSDFKLEYFKDIIESAVVKVRKPDPQIFQLGIDAMRKVMNKTAENLPASDIIVVGDSYTKDIIPAASLGCKTVWVKGVGWEKEEHDESAATHIIYNITELTDIIEKHYIY